MVKVKFKRTVSNNMNDILISKNRIIDLRDNGIKKNIQLRKEARRSNFQENIKKFFTLGFISILIIGIVGGNFNFKIDIVQAKTNDIDIKESYSEQAIYSIVGDIQDEENDREAIRQEQIKIKEKEIILYNEESERRNLERKKEEQKKEIEKVSKKVPDKIKTIVHNEWSLDDERQDWINYAYKIGGKDFVLTILAENGTMGIDRKSGLVGANGYSDYGLCQINVGYHPEILSDGKNGKRFVDWFYDPYKQLDYCNKKFTGGTRFYGYDVRYKVAHKIDIIEKI